MQKFIFLFSAFFCWIMQITSSDSSVQVRMGENVTLNCSMRNRYEIAWYHLRSERLNLLISAKKHKNGRKLLINYNQNSTHLKMTTNTGISTVSLIISEVAEPDLGLYFSGVKSDAPEMYFDKPIRLEDWRNKDVNEEGRDGVTETERVLMFGGVALAIFVFFLTTVLAGGIIHQRGWQKGWNAAESSSQIRDKSVK